MDLTNEDIENIADELYSEGGLLEDLSLLRGIQMYEEL